MRISLTATSLVLGLVLLTGRPSYAEEVVSESEVVSRDLAATDQVFTPEYLDRINAGQQAADEQRRIDRARHDKLIEFFMKR